MAGAEAAPLQNAQLVVEEQQGFLTGFPPFTKSFPSFSSSNPQSGPMLQTHPVRTVSTVGQVRPLPTLYLRNTSTFLATPCVPWLRLS